MNAHFYKAWSIKKIHYPAAIIEFAYGEFGKEFATGEFLQALHELDAPYEMQTYRQRSGAGVG